MKNKQLNIELPLLDVSYSESRNSRYEENHSARVSPLFNNNPNDSERVKSLEYLENPNRSFYILISCLLSVDAYILLYLIPKIPLFDYCSSTFFISEYTLSARDTKNDLRQSFKDIDCNVAFSECSEVCPVIEDLKFSIIFLLIGVALKFIFTSLEIFWLVLKNYKKFLTQIQVIYIVSETLGFLCLCLGYFLFNNSYKLSGLELNPGGSFSLKSFDYFTLSFLVFVGLSRLFTFQSLILHSS